MELLQHITLTTAGIGDPLVHDYLSGSDQVKKLYTFSPDIDGLKRAVEERKNYSTDRKLLYKVLHQQHAKSYLSDPLRTNIELLLQENTFTVTTGHQLNLFTGPLYFIYKIASVISLAKQLQDAIPGYNFVPVYWMNSEDHDFAEINHFFLKGEKFEWKVGPEKFGPVGKMNLEGIEGLMNGIKQKWAESYASDPAFEFIIHTYTQSGNLAEAHREIVNKLFADEGLVILDQDDEELKKEFSEKISQEIFGASAIVHIESTNTYLEQHGYKPQVFAREINYFYTGRGYRERIVKAGEGYALADGKISWTKTELQNELLKNPAYFSPNVVTRPMYQESVLPNIAYIGGPAEIAYWLQYKTNFSANHIFYPALILRDCFLLIPEKKLRKVKEFGLKVDDFFKPIDDILNEYIKINHQDDINVESIEKQLHHQYDLLLKRVKEIDPSMETMVKAAEQKALNELEKMVTKMRKALKTRHEAQLNMIRSLYATIFPDGVLQERHNNVYDHTTDIHSFIKEVISFSNCLDPRLKVLQY